MQQCQQCWKQMIMVASSQCLWIRVSSRTLTWSNGQTDPAAQIVKTMRSGFSSQLCSHSLNGLGASFGTIHWEFFGSDSLPRNKPKREVLISGLPGACLWPDQSVQPLVETLEMPSPCSWECLAFHPLPMPLSDKVLGEGKGTKACLICLLLQRSQTGSWLWRKRRPRE